MKLNEINANYFNRIDFHKPTKNRSGSAVQITALQDGSVSIQIAKQKTENTRQTKATYCWTEEDKNSFFMLSADEIRKISYLIKKVLDKRIRLFDQNQHKHPIKDGEELGFDYIFLFHSIGENSKTISFYFKKYNDKLQMTMNVFDKKKGKSNSFSFNFDLYEFLKLYDIFTMHQINEFQIARGYRSIICDSESEVLIDKFMPPLEIGTVVKFYKNGSEHKKTIKQKCYDITKGITVYII